MRWPVLLPFLVILSAPALSAPDATTAPPSGQTTASTPDDKMICKKQLETGTLAKYTKTCLTKAEWARLRDKSQALGQSLRDRNYSSCGPSVATRPSEMGPAC